MEYVEGTLADSRNLVHSVKQNTLGINFCNTIEDILLTERGYMHKQRGGEGDLESPSWMHTLHFLAVYIAKKNLILV